MSTKSFVPSVWESTLLENLHKAQVFANLCSRQYEGTITGQGDSVVIPMVGAIDIGDYTGADMAVQAPTGATVKLLIDQAKYYHYAVDDVDKVQAKPEFMAELQREAAYGLANTVDGQLAALHSKAGTTFTATITSANTISTVTKFHQRLDLKNVPKVGRALVVHPTFYEKMVLANIRFNTSNSNALEGYMGSTLGFDVYMSNNVVESSTGVFKIMAFTPRAIAFAQQLVVTEAGRKELQFKDYVRGLLVYGYKVVDPNALVTGTVTVTEAESSI